jgi:hypothetical protein
MLSLYQMRHHFDSQHDGGQAEPEEERAIKVGFEQAHVITFRAANCCALRIIEQVLAKV